MKKYFLLLALSLILYTSRSLITKQGVYGDGNAYYSYAYTLFFQQDLDFANIYHHLSNFQGPKYTFSRTFWDQRPTSVGMIPNQWLIGPAILWLPFLYLAQLLFMMVGYSPISTSLSWELAAGFGGISLGIFGLYLLEQLLKLFFSPRISSLTIITLFFCTNLFYYISLEPVLSHVNLFFLNTLLLFVLFKLNSQKSTTWFSAGLILGLATITRPSGIAGAIFFLPKLTLYWLHGKKPKLKKHLLASALGFILGILPQLVTQQILFGSFFSQPYITGYHGQIHLDYSHAIRGLFSVKRGLFTWTPLMFLSFIGLVLWNRPRKLSLIFLSYLLALLLIIGGWGGITSAGFGSRFFIESYPMLAFGLAYFFSTINSQRKLFFIIILSFYWNFALLTQFFYDRDRLVFDRGLTYANLITSQITVPLELTSNILQHGISSTITQHILD